MIYSIAGLKIFLDNKYSYTYNFCRNYLIEGETEYDIKATATAEEIEAEKQANAPKYPDGYIENICLYRSLCRQLPDFDRFLLHAAVLEKDGNAYAFLGKSGAGKSTHTGLWIKYMDGVKILNGDKPIISMDGDGFTVYGTPWNGKEGRGYNGSAPLRSLCFVEKASVNEITELTRSEVAMRIFTQILLPTDEKNAAKTLELIDKLIESVPSYLLRCDMTEEAVKICYEGLTGRTYVGKGE